MARSSQSIWLAFLALFAIYVSRVVAVTGQEPLKELQRPQYRIGQEIPVSCLNRSEETGEHITDDKNQLVYSPFPICNETGKPLVLHFGIEEEKNCTIDFISDPFYHILEFYVHNDAPLTCRIPSRPLAHSTTTSSSISSSSDPNDVGDEYIPLIFALTGTLQKSHLHVSNHMNVLLHALPKHVSPGVVDSATAYSISHHTKNTQLIIGDPLSFKLSIRWYPDTRLPSGWTGVGGHLFLSTLVYCMLSAGAATAVCVVYYRGVVLPKRLREYGREKVFAGGDSGYRGYGYGIGNGKVD